MRFSLRRYRKKTPKPVKAAVSGKDIEVRPAIAQVYLDLEKGKPMLVATNSYILAKIPIDVYSDDKDEKVEPAVIPRAAMEAIQRLPFKNSWSRTDFEIENGDVTVAGEVVYKGKDYTFPNWREMLKTYEEVEKPKEPLRIGFNVKMLKDLADALAEDVLEVTIDLDKVINPEGGPAVYERPLVVRPLGAGNQDGREGLQMPVRLDVR